jgi:hypothetical protein
VSVFSARERSYERPKFNNLKATWTFGPVVMPADDDIATLRIVAVLAEVPTLELELDPHPLPTAVGHLPFGLAVVEARLDGLDVVAEFAGDHAEQEDDTLLVHWLVA